MQPSESEVTKRRAPPRRARQGDPASDEQQEKPSEKHGLGTRLVYIAHGNCKRLYPLFTGVEIEIESKRTISANIDWVIMQLSNQASPRAH